MWVCGRSLVGIVISNPARGHGCLPLVSVVCCQVEIYASVRSPVQRSPTECGVSNECDRGAPLEKAMARNRVEAPQGKIYINIYIYRNGRDSQLLQT